MNIALIKIGGSVLVNPQLPQAIAFIQSTLHMLPVVVHGAGPQLNKNLEQNRITHEFQNGIRITTPKVLSIAMKTFRNANVDLCLNLLNNGLKCVSVNGVFEASYLNKNVYEFVGKTNKIDLSNINRVLQNNNIPVLSCLAETESGQCLNVNADIAAIDLAKVLKPREIYYLNDNGGLLDPLDNSVIDHIDLPSDYEKYASRMKHGTLLKLKEIKQLLEDVPESTVTITSCANIINKHKGTVFSSSFSTSKRLFSSQRRLFSTTQPNNVIKVGLIGARGYVGQELIKLLDTHPNFSLEHISSRDQTSTIHLPYSNKYVTYTSTSPDDVSKYDVDAWILAMPNGVASSFVKNIPPGKVIVDLSADYRFTQDDQWIYGLPELYNTRELFKTSKSKFISNPGCYATGGQVALYPLVIQGLVHSSSIFGISGYSGAGTNKTKRNDPKTLKDNLIPYSLVGHIHEREIGYHLRKFANMSTSVHFMPHVAPFFRGITLTVDISLKKSITKKSVLELYDRQYSKEKLITVLEKDEGGVGDGIPLVRDVEGENGVFVGGFYLSKSDGVLVTQENEAGNRVVIVVTLDNLLKGAATQALQNLNLAFNLNEYTGIVENSFNGRSFKA